MMECRKAIEALPEYIAGRFLPLREDLDAHLSQCRACEETYFEMKAVFELLEAIPDPPVSHYAEANAGLALRSTIAPGPLRAFERQGRREAVLFGVCSFASFTGTAVFAAGITSLYHARVTGRQALAWAENWLHKALNLDLSWQIVAFFVVASGIASLLPAILLNTSISPDSRRLRKEV
jgi:hypothetical protein